MTEPGTRETLVPLTAVADFFRIGLPLARDICEKRGVRRAGGLADLSQLLRMLDLPEDLPTEFVPGSPFFLTVDELAAHLGVSARTIRNRGDGAPGSARFPRQIDLSPRHRRFFARDVHAMAYHVAGACSPLPEPAISEARQSGGAESAAPSDAYVVSVDLDDLIPTVPRSKRQRKK